MPPNSPFLRRNHTEWWITGGRSSSRGNLDSTIVLTAGEDAFQVMPSLRLPLPLRGHSLVQLNGTHLFLHGGFVPPDRNLRRAWTMDLREGRWREQRPSAVGRRKAFAGLVNIDDEQVGDDPMRQISFPTDNAIANLVLLYIYKKRRKNKLLGCAIPRLGVCRGICSDGAAQNNPKFDPITSGVAVGMALVVPILVGLAIM